MSVAPPPRVWITVEHRPPDYLGPSFFPAAEIRNALREAGTLAYLFAVERDLAEVRSPDHRAVVFPVEEVYPHPGYAEDPVGLRRALEGLGLPFVGSGSQAVLAASEKDCAKQTLAAGGLEVPAGVCLRDRAAAAEQLGSFLEKLSCPAVIKPVSGRGGSLGVEHVADAALLRRRVDEWRRGDAGPLLIEELVPGPEVSVWVLGVEPDLRCLRVVQIDKGDRPILDRASKLAGGDLDGFQAPRGSATPHAHAPSLPTAELDRVAAAALAAHRLLGAYSYSRVDIIVRDGRPVVLEVNTRPTLGSQGGLALSGERPETFGVLLAELVGHALHRPAPAAADA